MAKLLPCDDKMLAKIVATNGGGYNPFEREDRSIGRLLNAGLITEKGGSRATDPSRMFAQQRYIHTRDGLERHRALTATKEQR